MNSKVACRGMTSSDVVLNWIAFDHVAALLESHLLAVFVGATEVQVPAQRLLADPVHFLRLVDTHRVTVTFSPNFLLGSIVKSHRATPDEPSLDLSGLRHIIPGGEALVGATARNLFDLFAPHGLRRNAL
jgi:acyl-CoA synthetase (AMP-forming)/AMP-acid ligase II